MASAFLGYTPSSASELRAELALTEKELRAHRLLLGTSAVADAAGQAWHGVKTRALQERCAALRREIAGDAPK